MGGKGGGALQGGRMWRQGLERGWGSSGRPSVEARVSEWVGKGVGLFREAECGGKG